MKMTQVFKSLGPIDARNVRRDSLGELDDFHPVSSGLFHSMGSSTAVSRRFGALRVGSDTLLPADHEFLFSSY